MRALWWSLVGLVLFGLAAVVIVVAFGELSNGTSDVTDLDVGDCFDLDPDEDGNVGLVDVVACDEPHNAEVVAIAELNPDGDLPYPPDDELFPLADRRCAAIPPDDRFGVVAVAPTESTWEARSGRVVCVALVYADGRVTGSHRATLDA